MPRGFEGLRGPSLIIPHSSDCKRPMPQLYGPLPGAGAPGINQAMRRLAQKARPAAGSNHHLPVQREKTNGENQRELEKTLESGSWPAKPRGTKIVCAVPKPFSSNATLLLPGTQKAARNHQLGHVVGIVICHKERFPQNGLTISPGNLSVQVGRRIGHKLLHLVQISLELLDALLPGS